MITYCIFDYYDVGYFNPKHYESKNKLRVSDQFDLDDVTYIVTKKFKHHLHNEVCLVIKMIRYKISDSSTTFVHKCPALKGETTKLNQKQFKTLIEKHGEKKVNDWINVGRIKMHSMNLVNICPHCGVVYYKDKIKVPEEIDVISTSNKKKLRK
jgi:hypothetical protein